MTSKSKSKPKLTLKPSQIDPEEYYVLIEKLGKGSFGEVYKAIVRETKENLAVKVIKLEEAKDEIDEIQNEITFLSLCRHPNITAYQQSFVKGMKLWMVMELMVGSAQDMMKPKGLGPFCEEEVAVFVKQVVDALQYLHQWNIIHRDLKAANLLISSTGDIKLADFGVAYLLRIDKTSATSFAGTPHWVAPEMIKQQPYTTKVDIWSLGITIYELFKGEPPNAGLPSNRALQITATSSPPELEGEYSKQLREFFTLCLTPDPAKRPSASELAKHKFVKGAKKKKNFLQARMEEFEKWRTHGGADSDSDDSTDDSDEEYEGDHVPWDFSTGSTDLVPNQIQDPEKASKPDWLSSMKPASKNQRRATRVKNKKKKSKY